MNILVFSATNPYHVTRVQRPHPNAEGKGSLPLALCKHIYQTEFQEEILVLLHASKMICEITI